MEGNSRGGGRGNKGRGRGYSKGGQFQSARGRGSSPSGNIPGGSADVPGTPEGNPRAEKESLESPEVRPEVPQTCEGNREEKMSSPSDEKVTTEAAADTPESQSGPGDQGTLSPDAEFVTPTNSPSYTTKDETPSSTSFDQTITQPQKIEQEQEQQEPEKIPEPENILEPEKMSESEKIPEPVTIPDPNVTPIPAAEDMKVVLETPKNERSFEVKDTPFTVISSIVSSNEALPDLESVGNVTLTESTTPAKAGTTPGILEKESEGANQKEEASGGKKKKNKKNKVGGDGGDPEGDDNCDSEDSLLTTGRRPSTPDEDSGPRGWMGFTKRQLLTLLVFSVADFFSAILISLQAPFYPQEAEAKGATATEYGLVFGVFELVVFLTSPIYGKYLNKLGPKHVFNTGICVAGISTIAFGFLDRFDDRATFVSLCFVVRIIEALGDAAFITASFAIIASEFPDSVATTFASLETFFGLGLIVGPTLGGALYQKGGFTLPFAVMGGLLLVVGFLTFLLMPKAKQPETSEKESPGGLIAILRVPGVALAAMAIVTGSITIGFLNSTLEPHIRQFNLNPVLTGLVFIINGGLYAVTAPAWGWLCDRVIPPIYVGLIGAVDIFVAFLLIGPVQFLPIDTVLWLTCLGLVIHGIGLGATLVSSFVMALKESINHGFADNIKTYGLTSALWTSSFAFGSFVGPSIGGILLDQVGFRWASLFILGVQTILFILITIFITKKRGQIACYTNDNLSENVPLLGAVSEDPCTSKTALARQNGSNNGSYGATESTIP